MTGARIVSEENVTVFGSSWPMSKAGSGPPLLYLHGQIEMSPWSPFLDLLVDGATVYRPDHPGFGASSDDPRLDSIHDLAFAYLDLLNRPFTERRRPVLDQGARSGAPEPPARWPSSQDTRSAVTSARLTSLKTS